MKALKDPTTPSPPLETSHNRCSFPPLYEDDDSPSLTDEAYPGEFGPHHDPWLDEIEWTIREYTERVGVAYGLTVEMGKGPDGVWRMKE